MISNQAARALSLITAIDLCKQADADFWRGVVTRIMLDLDEAGAKLHVSQIRELLARMWSELPEKQVMTEDEKNELIADSILVIRAKWTIDGATSLEDAAVKAEEFAAYLRELAGEGYELTGPVEDDYGSARKGEPAS